MKKIILLLNDYLASFWFGLWLIAIGCLAIVLFNPLLIAISLNYDTNLTGIINIFFDFWMIFLLPLAVISILISVLIWLKKDKNKGNYRGLSALIITLLSVSFLFILITQLNNLNYLIQADAYHLKTVEPLTVSNNTKINQNEQAVINTVTEDSLQKLTNVPAEVKSVFSNNNKTYLSLDILSRNENFNPETNDGLFINQSRRLREFLVDEKTASYVCGVGQDGNASTADIIANTQDIINTLQSGILNKTRAIYEFDLEGGIVKNIYQVCLP
jgi:protein involved in ribonucleotide reduction